MSVAEGLIVVLPAREDVDVTWMRVVDDGIVQQGNGDQWLSACGLSALPPGARTMLVPPAPLIALHWVHYPEMPARQGRAASRLAALETSIGPADALVAAANENDDPALAHIVAVAARADMQHWLLWAQRHGLDPDAIVPAPLLLPAPEDGYAQAGYIQGSIGGVEALQGGASGALADGDPLTPVLIGDAAIEPAAPDWIGALATPPLNLRQGDFAKRVRRSIDGRQVMRIAVWCGFIALASLMIALLTIAKYHAEARRLDAESIVLAREILPAANDPALIQAELDAKLAARGASAYLFGGPAAGLFTAMQNVPGVSLASLSRAADGTLQAQLASARAEDINMVLLALQAAGFTITATSSRDPGGRVVADITVHA